MICFRGAVIWTQLIAAVAIHRHPSLITLRSACDDPSGGVAPPKSHNLIQHRHQRNPTTRYIIYSGLRLTTMAVGDSEALRQLTYYD